MSSNITENANARLCIKAKLNTCISSHHIYHLLVNREKSRQKTRRKYSCKNKTNEEAREKHTFVFTAIHKYGDLK